MKTLTTVKIMMLAVALGVSTQQAFAADTITCKASNNEIFSFSIADLSNSLNKIPSDIYYSGMANDLHPKGAAIKALPTTFIVEALMKRIITGYHYSFELPMGTSVFLTHELQWGTIEGSAHLIDGTSLDLSCQ